MVDNLNLFNQGGLFGPAGGGFGGLLDPRAQAMLGAAQVLGQAGGPSRMPISTGAALSSAMAQGVNSYRQAQAAAAQQQMARLNYTAKLQEMRDKATQRQAMAKLMGGLGGAPESPLAVPAVPAVPVAPIGVAEIQSGDTARAAAAARTNLDDKISAPPSTGSIEQAAPPQSLGFTAQDRMRLAAAGPGKFGQVYGDILKEKEAAKEAFQKNLNRRSERATKLRKGFRTDTKNDFTILEYARNGLSADNNHIGDVTLLYSYIKAIDPASVVREGEVKLTKPGLIPQTLIDIYNALSTGELSRMAPTVRKGILQSLHNLSEKSRKRVGYHKDLYGRRARRSHVRGDSVIMDPESVLPKLPGPLNFNNASEG
mgnify:CR=1 FL=1